jgi:hypothetical protein
MAYLFEDIVDDNMLNQDDEIFQDDSTSRAVSVDDYSDSPDDYQYKIFFNMSQIAKDKTLGWYISHLSEFQDIFLNILKNYRIFENVQESRPKFIIGSSSGNENYTYSYSVDNNFSISHLT